MSNDAKSQKPKPSTLVEEYKQEFNLLQKRMMVGVITDYQTSTSEQPHDYRVGINTALVQLSAISALLIARGVLDETDFWRAMRDSMEIEVKRYEETLAQRFGTQVRITPPIDGEK